MFHKTPFFTLVLVLLTSLSTYSQDLTYARTLLKDLCSEDMYGRAYVGRGDSIAADYIASELKKLKIKSFEDGYWQRLTMQINGLERAEVRIPGVSLEPGIEILVEASSPSLQGTFPVVQVDADALKRPGAFLNQLAGNPEVFVLLDSVGLNNPSLYSFAKTLIHSSLMQPKGIIEMVHRVPFGVVRKHFDPYVKIQLLADAIEELPREITVDIKNQYYPAYPTQNVIGYIPGKSDEWIVFCGHYDGEGMHGDALFPAGNDNASGTVMVMDLARHYSKGKKPYYNIAFMLFAGEEAGLLGSSHYVKNPLFPLEDIRMVINLDMVGTGQDGCTLFNATTHPEETRLIHKLNGDSKYLWLIRERGPAANSDHHPFYLNKVPALFFITAGKAGPAHTAADTEEDLTMYAYENLFRLILDFVDELPKMKKGDEG